MKVGRVATLLSLLLALVKQFLLGMTPWMAMVKTALMVLGDKRLSTDGLTMPTAVDCLDPASSIPVEYRTATDEYEALPEDHLQYAYPSIQVGFD